MHACRTALFASLLLLSTSSRHAQAQAGLAGHWEGKILIPDREMGITLDLSQSSTGVWIGSMSIPVSTSIDVPLADIVVEDTNLRFTVSLPFKTSFEGQLSKDAAGVSGQASNIDGKVLFQVTRNGAANVKVPPLSSVLTKDFEGVWEATLEVNGKATRIGLTLTRAADGLATGVLIDQNSREIPVSTVTVKDKELQLESRAISGAFHGTLAGGDIVGQWTQRSNRVPLTFKRAPSGAK